MERIKKLQESLVYDALLIEDLVNIYYLVGIEMSAGRILVQKNKAQLIVDSRYYEACVKKSPIPVVLSKNEILKELLVGCHQLAFDSGTTTYKSYQDLCESLKNIELIPVLSPVEALRIIKDEGEAKALRESADLGSEGYDFVCSQLKEGITELELAIELEIFWKRRGSKGLGFDPIIAFGSNSSMPHYRAQNVKLKAGDTVLIDIGVNLRHYYSDMTRVVFYGKPEPEMVQIYEIVKTAQQLALDLCKPGIEVRKLDEAARGYIASKGYGDRFTHNLGHGVGLEIHEAPTLRSVSPYGEVYLQPGMVITIEPGIYLPGLGGVRIEDTVLITEEGHENLTKRPKEYAQL